MSGVPHAYDSRPDDVSTVHIPAQRAGDDRDSLGTRLTFCGMLLQPEARLADAVRRLTGAEELCWHAPTGPGSVLERSGGPRDDLALQVGIQMRASGWPAWVDHLDRLGIRLPSAAEESKEPAVLVAVSTGGSGPSRRTVLWCFGRISHSIPAEALDRRFGLVVVLNKHVTSTPAASWRPLPSQLPKRRRPAGPKNHVRRIESEVTRGSPHRSSARGMGPSSLEGLRFDITSDQVRRVGLDTDDPLIGPMEGGRSLRFDTYVRTLDDFITLTDHVLEMRGRCDYQRDWEWIDHSTPVTGRKEIDRVLNALYERIRNEDDPLVDLMIPDLVVDQDDPNTSVAYALPYERGFTRSALSWADVREWLRTRPQLSRWDVPLRHVDVRLQVDAEEHKVPLQALLTAELRVGNEVFVLSDGDVLRIDKSYLEQVDAYVERIPWTDFPFPPYEGGTEGRYLDKAIKTWPRRLAKLDLRDTRLPGETAFETCDLFSDDMRLIFAKLKGRTSRFSHLCTQAETAATVFNRSEPAREQLVGRVDDATDEAGVRESARRVARALAAGRQRDVTITLLLLGSWRRRTLRTLPLASKQRLTGLAKQLRSLGYRFEVAAPTTCDQSELASRETSRSTSTP